jgi:glycosyltransferase involved in cell wall biosynthesis
VSHEDARLSLVIPCYNDGRFVPAAVASVREDEPVEIVIVDDGSTDPDTLRVLDGLRESGIRVIRQDNAGLAAARMRGVAETSRRFVLCLDSDDELAPGALGALADALEADPGAAFALGSLALFGAQSDVRSFPPWDPWRLLYANHWTAHGLFRREELTAVGGWTLADCYEDWDLLLALAERDRRPVILDRVAVRYRQHAEARMRTRCRCRHAEVYAVLRVRHAALFARRAELARRSPAALWMRLTFPLVLGSRRLYPVAVNRQVDRLRAARAQS